MYFGLEVVAHVDAAVIVAEPHAGRCAGGERTELLPNRLPDRLERLEPVRPLAHVNANAVCAAVVYGGEDGHLAILFGEGRRGIGAPQLVGCRRHDRSLPLAW